jgi:hypothetical protein
MPAPICNDQGHWGATPCQTPAPLVLRLLDERHFACAPHAKTTRDECAPGEVAVYPMTYNPERNLATWTEGDQPYAATVIALPGGSTRPRLVSPRAELRCLTCDVVEFTATAEVPVSIQLDTEEGTVTAVKVLDEETGPPSGFQCENGHLADQHLAAALLTLTQEVDWPRWTIG